jgi:hypothetical protein
MTGIPKGHVYAKVSCEVCAKDVAVNQLGRHMRAKHGVGTTAGEKCPECKATITHHNLRRHLHRIHGITVEPRGLSTLVALTDGKPPKEPRPTPNVDGTIPCPECGKPCAPNGYPNHVASHRRALGVATVPVAKNHTATVDAVQAISGVPGSLNNLTSMEVAMAVLARLSTTGTIKIIDLPEVMGWVAATDQIVRLVSQP